MNHAQRSILKWMVITGIALGITACGKPSETITPDPVKKTVLDDTIANKERAKRQTEQAMQQNQEKLEAAMKKVDESGTQ